MFELLKSGGLLIIPLLICSFMAMTIVAERFWTLRREKIVPKHLVNQIWNWINSNELTQGRIRALEEDSPLGRFLAAGLSVAENGNRDQVKERMNEAGRQITLILERYLNTLGTIATITPLLGLLGTVVGMIDVFTVITYQGVGNAEALAGGISQALITTAAGLSIAIPTLIFHRHFHRRVDEMLAIMEHDGVRLLEIIFSTKAHKLSAKKD